MARRPIFLPDDGAGTRTTDLDFTWHPGMSSSQKQRSIASLHDAAREAGVDPVLEISTKSPDALGVALSAFRLRVLPPGAAPATVEEHFQAGKVFERGGPFGDLVGAGPRAAKRDERLRTSGTLIAFESAGVRWPLAPATAFYDWLYVLALTQNEALSDELLAFAGFTDIEFNPRRSLNCQARSAALFVSLHRRGRMPAATASREAWLAALDGAPSKTPERQGELGFEWP